MNEDGKTKRWTDRLTDKASYRVAYTRLKLSNKAKWKENKENEKYEK